MIFTKCGGDLDTIAYEMRDSGVRLALLEKWNPRTAREFAIGLLAGHYTASNHGQERDA